MHKVSNNRSSCPVSTVLDLMGDRWSLLIVRDLFMQRTTFSDFLAAPEKISSNILTDRLQKLKGYQIIDYAHDPNNRKIKKYFLTDRGLIYTRSSAKCPIGVKNTWTWNFTLFRSLGLRKMKTSPWAKSSKTTPKVILRLEKK